MEKKKIADGLNKLIEINNDRIEGYERAEKETDDNGLKTLFTRFAAQSRSYKSELEGLVRSHGEDPAEGTTTSGKFYRAWMDIKSALTGKDKKAIVASCEYGEDVAKETYQEVIKDLDGASPTIQSILQRQHAELKEAHDKVKMLRDSIVD